MVFLFIIRFRVFFSVQSIDAVGKPRFTYNVERGWPSGQRGRGDLEDPGSNPGATTCQFVTISQ